MNCLLIVFCSGASAKGRARSASHRLTWGAAVCCLVDYVATTDSGLLYISEMS